MLSRWPKSDPNPTRHVFRLIWSLEKILQSKPHLKYHNNLLTCSEVAVGFPSLVNLATSYEKTATITFDQTRQQIKAGLSLFSAAIQNNEEVLIIFLPLTDIKIGEKWWIERKDLRKTSRWGLSQVWFVLTYFITLRWYIRYLLSWAIEKAEARSSVTTVL